MKTNESKTKPRDEKTKARRELISIKEAVGRYPLGKDWYYRHMEKGTLPFPWYPLTVGKRFMDTADIEAWLDCRKVPAGSMPGDIKEAL